MNSLQNLRNLSTLLRDDSDDGDNRAPNRVPEDFGQSASNNHQFINSFSSNIHEAEPVASPLSAAYSPEILDEHVNKNNAEDFIGISTKPIQGSLNYGPALERSRRRIKVQHCHFFRLLILISAFIFKAPRNIFSRHIYD